MAGKILGIAGSLRKDSYNKAVVQTLAESAWEGVEIEIFDLSSIPLYNADLDGEHPPDPVRKFKDAIAASVGVLVVSPEYNYGIPGVLKNALRHHPTFARSDFQVLPLSETRARHEMSP